MLRKSGHLNIFPATWRAPSVDEDHVIEWKAPEQPLSGPCGEMFSQLLFPTSRMNPPLKAN